MMGIGMGFGVLGLIFMLFVVGILVVGGVLLVRALFPSNSMGTSSSSELGNARELLDRRYARGDITREEYDLIKRDLS